jgi:hypothetical protein
MFSLYYELFSSLHTTPKWRKCGECAIWIYSKDELIQSLEQALTSQVLVLPLFSTLIEYLQYILNTGSIMQYLNVV